MQTLDQQRADFAWRLVRRAKSQRYGALAKSLPALVMTSGLMQTLAFLQGKGDGKEGKQSSEHAELLRDILEWLANDKVGVLPAAGEMDFARAMGSLTEMSSLEYQRATEESLAILRWIRYLAATVGNNDKEGAHEPRRP